MTDVAVETRPPGERARAPRVTLLVPAKDEEAGIRETVLSLPVEALEARGFVVDVLVVDGQSADRTREVAREAGARVVVQVGKGKGNAVRAALGAVDSDFVAMIDADGTYPAERIPDMVALLERGVDVVMGSRFRGVVHDGALSGLNRLGNVVLSAGATVLFGRRCTDVCTGLWAFRREAVAALPLASDGYEIEAEIYAESVKAGLHVVEVPIDYRARLGETKLSPLADGWRIGLTLLKCRFRSPFRPLPAAAWPEMARRAAAPPLVAFEG